MLALRSDVPDEEKIHAQLVVTRGAHQGLTLQALRVLTGLDLITLEKALAGLASARRAFCYDREARAYIADVFFEESAIACQQAAAAFHQRHPERQGLKRGELTAAWDKNLPPKLVHAVVEQLIKQGRLETQGEYLRLPGHAAAFNKDQAPLSEALLAAYQQAGMSPPNSGELLESLDVTPKQAAPVLAALRDAGKLVRVAEGVWYAAEHLEAAEKALREWFREHESIDLAGYKSVTGLSRKYLVALLEYFDAQRVTMRVGDARVLRGKASE
jgi:selenocysteine-specific elongation factor